MSSFAESTNACNFADNICSYVYYVCDKYLNSLINRLEHDRYQAIEQVKNNSIKLNQHKCHLLVSEFKQENVWEKIRKIKTSESKKKKEGVEMKVQKESVEIDRTLSFDEYIGFLCRKTKKKLSVLGKLSNFMLQI